MRFCILGSNRVRGRIKYKPVYETENLSDAIITFEGYVDEIRYKTMYLVVDFESSLIKKSIFGTSLEEDGSMRIPFFIIGEYNIDENNIEAWVRCDHTQIVHKGFTRDFDNNLAAIKEYLKIVSIAREMVEFKVVYQRNLFREGREYIRTFNRTISYSHEIVMGARGERKPVKKFIINKLDWIFVPIKERQLNIYDLKGNTSSVNGTL